MEIIYVISTIALFTYNYKMQKRYERKTQFGYSNKYQIRNVILAIGSVLLAVVIVYIKYIDNIS